MTVLGCWVDEGERPNYPLLRKYGINTVFMSARSDREGVTAKTFDEIRAQGFDAAIYVGHTWDEADGLTPEQSAERMNAQWLRFRGNVSRLYVMFNDEGKDIEQIRRKIGRWRELRPGARTFLSPEGFQGGILWQLRDFLIVRRIVMVPQNYGGNMTLEDQWDSHGTVMDLVLHGWPLDLVLPFYDARFLRRGWEVGGGFLFTQQRLPA